MDPDDPTVSFPLRKAEVTVTETPRLSDVKTPASETLTCIDNSWKSDCLVVFMLVRFSSWLSSGINLISKEKFHL